MGVLRTIVLPAALLLIASLVYCRAFIEPFLQDGSWTANYDPVAFASSGRWQPTDRLLLTGHDWDVHYFYQTAVQRSVVGERQWPFWNPWTKGGASLWGNPEVQFPTPMWLANLLAGPIGGARVQVILHHWIGLLGGWWLARILGCSWRAAALASCTFMMSTWYSLHLATGHATFWSAAYMPIALGGLWLARRDLRWTLGAAASLALVIFEGGAYVYLIFLVLAGTISAGWAVTSRSWRPLVALALAVLFSVAFAAVRLAPQTALLERYPRETQPLRAAYDRLLEDIEGEGRRGAQEAGDPRRASTEPTMALTGVQALVAQLARIFVGRVQEVGKFYYRYQGYGWHEYGAYVGAATILLLCLGPFVLWRQMSVLWPWYGAGLVCFLLALGNFASFAPWTLLHQLPIYSQSRVPSRYLIPVVLCIAMGAALTWDRLWQRFAANSQRRRLLFDVGLVLVCADLIVVGGRAFVNRAELTRVAIPPVAATATTLVAGEQQQAALAIAGYRARNGYEAIPVISHAAAVGEPGYKGEVYLEARTTSAEDVAVRTAPQALQQTWSPGRLTLQPPAGHDGWVVWNMNWAPGWRSDPPGLVESRDGRLAVALQGHTGPVTLYYVPERLGLGLVISVAALLAAAAWLSLTSTGVRL